MRDDDVEHNGTINIHGDVGAGVIAVVPGNAARDAVLVRVVVGNNGFADIGKAVSAVRGPRRRRKSGDERGGVDSVVCLGGGGRRRTQPTQGPGDPPAHLPPRVQGRAT